MAQLALFRVPRVEPLRSLGAPCFECGVSTLEIDEWYMVRAEVWRTAVPWEGPAGAMFNFLCIGCLEARLGRLLVASDFTDVPVNTSVCASRRLKARRAATRTCQCGCGASLDGRRATVRYFDGACRTKALRARKAYAPTRTPKNQDVTVPRPPTGLSEAA
jgi:hypothetical protein